MNAATLQADADSATFGQGKQKRQDFLEQQVAAHRDYFYHLFLTAKAETMASGDVARSLEYNVSGADMHAIFKALVTGNQPEASRLVREALEVAATYYAETEVSA